MDTEISKPIRTSLQTETRLLIIDDEPLMLKMIKGILQKAFYQITTCGSAKEALRLLDQTPFDCVISDVIMPEMNGYDFVTAVRTKPQFSNLPILLLTRKRNREDVKKAVEVGATDYVLKPIDEALFLDKIEMCLKKGFGKRHIFELPMTGPLSQGSIQIECDILSLSESDLTLWSQIPLTDHLPFLLKTRLFHEIGIDFPHMKIVKCDLMPSSGARSAGYLIKLAFLGLGETELRKIRAWIQKEMLRQKK